MIGLMGSGKSTIGRQLARRLDKEFIDTDSEIEQRTGVTISAIFDLEGEAGFRDREQTVLAQLVKGENIVLATGGGVVLRADNQETLACHGTVVYLHTAVEVLWERVRKAKNRPLLNIENPRHRLAMLYEQRDPLYRAIAHFIVECERESMPALVKKLQQSIENF